MSKASESALEIAVFDEDSSFARGLCAMLTTEGYCCRAYSSFVASELAVQALDVVVLDLGAPRFARLEVIRHIRSLSEVPILVVTADHRERDKVVALDLGADDYLTKPIAPGEFLARVRVALRHSGARGPVGAQVALGDLHINLERREVSLRAVRLALTPTDYKLIALLARNVGRVVSHARLLQAGWGPNAHDPHYLRVYMARLRRKLDPERSGSRFIVTEPGVGYRLSEQASSQRGKT
ncbi:MAG: response regulator transcription factor [Polyangiaceae bacterium]